MGYRGRQETLFRTGALDDGDPVLKDVSVDKSSALGAPSQGQSAPQIQAGFPGRWCGMATPPTQRWEDGLLEAAPGLILWGEGLLPLPRALRTPSQGPGDAGG